MIKGLIKNEKDYRETLSRIETHMDEKPGTERMDAQNNFTFIPFQLEISSCAIFLNAPF